MKTTTAIRNLTLAALASLTLGGCYYGDVYGASYADADCYSRYGDQYWINDPFAYDDGYYGYDCYDAADYRSGFVQIGFGGGWHQQLYYPGYGLFMFDRFGRRHAMTHDYLTYWGGRRAWWKHHGHRYRDGNHDRGRDGHYDGRRPGRGYGDGNWRNSPGAAPVPNDRPRGDRPRRDWRNAPGAAPATGVDPNPGAVPYPGDRPRGDRPRRDWDNMPGAAPIPDAVPQPGAMPDPADRPRREFRRNPEAVPGPDPVTIVDPSAVPGDRPRGGGGQGRPRGDGNARPWSPPMVIDSPQSAAPQPTPDQPRFSLPPISVEADQPMAQRVTRPAPRSDPEPPRFRRPTSGSLEGAIKEE